MDGYREVNRRALAVLERGEFEEAQALLQANAKRYPNGCTLNNLGMFYYTCGMRKKSGRLVSAWSRGVKYLRRAAARERSAVVCGNLGAAAFQDKRYREAYGLFREAHEKRGGCVLTYNMGVCMYWSGNYERARDLFALVLDRASVEGIREAMGPHPVFPFCFSALAVREPKQKIEEALQPFWQELHNTHDSFDLFTLLFSLGLFRGAWACVEMLVRGWVLDKAVGAMIRECARQVGEDADALVEYGGPRDDGADGVELRRRIAEFRYIPPCAAVEQWMY